MAKIVVGLFDNPRQAQQAVVELVDTGISHENISTLPLIPGTMTRAILPRLEEQILMRTRASAKRSATSSHHSLGLMPMRTQATMLTLLVGVERLSPLIQTATKWLRERPT